MDLSAAPATYALIAVNCIISLYALYGDRNFINEFAFNVGAVMRGKQHYRVITAAFLHADIAHLLMNMVTLFFFGPVVEQTLGTDGMIAVYFGSIVTSKLLAIQNNRKNPEYSAVGASGAVSGVIMSFCVFYPFQPIYFIGLPIGIPAFLFGIGYMLLSARLMQNANRIIGHEAHLGGALGGIVLTLIMRPDVLTQWFG